MNTSLKNITVAELAVMGMATLAYVKPMSTTAGQMSYAIHAADGTAIAVTDDFRSALEAILENDLLPVAVH